LKKRLEILGPTGLGGVKHLLTTKPSPISKIFSPGLLIKDVFPPKTGAFGTYAPIWGQEACQVGSATLLEKGDWVFPAFRELAATFVMGVPLKAILLYWMGNEMGSRAPDGINVMPVSIPVGTHPLHAVGAAWAAKLRGEKTVTIAYFGDGATSKGDFHEANLAGVFKNPDNLLSAKQPVCHLGSKEASNA
jgi:hypothetical protein